MVSINSLFSPHFFFFLIYHVFKTVLNFFFNLPWFSRKKFSDAHQWRHGNAQWAWPLIVCGGHQQRGPWAFPSFVKIMLNLLLNISLPDISQRGDFRFVFHWPFKLLEFNSCFFLIKLFGRLFMMKKTFENLLLYHGINKFYGTFSSISMFYLILYYLQLFYEINLTNHRHPIWDNLKKFSPLHQTTWIISPSHILVL